MLALNTPRAAEANYERYRRSESRGQPDDERRAREGAKAEPADAERIRHPLGVLERPGAEGGGDEGGAPGRDRDPADETPARAGRSPGRKQQRDQTEQGDQGGNPGPVLEPERDFRRGMGAGVAERRVPVEGIGEH